MKRSKPKPTHSAGDDRFEKSLERKRESKNVEFKESFDPTSAQEWCELVKDVVAIGNSGGGVILFGVANNGTPVGHDLGQLTKLDPAQISDKLFRYTRQHLSDFQLIEGRKNGKAVVGLVIGPNAVPVVFEEPGTYIRDTGKQSTAFSKGTCYFRHGAKSEPGTTADLRWAIENRLASIRKEWLSGVSKVVSAPSGSHVAVVSGDVVQSADPSAFPIRLTDDPDAPVYRVVDIDQNYPFRQKEVIEQVNSRRSAADVNAFDILTARRAHGIDQDLRYCHTAKFGSPQYSEAFVQWLVDRYDADPKFFQGCRSKYRQ